MRVLSDESWDIISKVGLSLLKSEDEKDAYKYAGIMFVLTKLEKIPDK